MPDLSFQQLAAKLPPGSLVEAGDDVTISLQALMGEPMVDLGNMKVAEALSKLLDGAAQAQAAYNADPTNTQDLTSYPAPTAGVATRDANGNWVSNMTHTLTVRIPLNRAETTANFV